MNKFYSGVLLGVFIGMVLGVVSQGFFSGEFEAINKCQKDLPRSQICVITAVPKQEAAGHEQ